MSNARCMVRTTATAVAATATLTALVSLILVAFANQVKQMLGSLNLFSSFFNLFCSVLASQIEHHYTFFFIQTTIEFHFNYVCSVWLANTEGSDAEYYGEQSTNLCYVLYINKHHTIHTKS